MGVKDDLDQIDRSMSCHTLFVGFSRKEWMKKLLYRPDQSDHLLTVLKEKNHGVLCKGGAEKIIGKCRFREPSDQLHYDITACAFFDMIRCRNSFSLIIPSSGPTSSVSKYMLLWASVQLP